MRSAKAWPSSVVTWRVNSCDVSPLCRHQRYLVDLVSDNDLDHVLSAVRVNLAEPLDQLVKGVALRYVIDCPSATDHETAALGSPRMTPWAPR